MEAMWELPFAVPWLDDAARYCHSLPLYPLFKSVHFILTAFALRKEPGSVHFAFKHPVASCVMTYIVASSGGILANLMVGAPPLECVVNGWNVFVAVLSWYLIFFSPLDVCFHLCAAMPVQMALFSVEELGRAKKILSGVAMASDLYPQSMLAMAIVGMIKGSGKKWGITWYRLVYQPQSASTMELKGISFITKVAMFLALLFAFNVQSRFCEEHQLLLVAALCLIALITKVAMFLALLFAFNVQSRFCEEHQLLLVAALCLIAIRYRSLFVAETDFFEPALQTFWKCATLLTFEPPPQATPPTDGIRTSSKDTLRKDGGHTSTSDDSKTATPDHDKSE